MAWNIAGTDHDLEAWKAARRRLITASDMKLFIPGLELPPYIKETADDIIAAKQAGEDREMPLRAKASLIHGRMNEAGIAKKASMMLGLPMVEYHYLVVNERWPMIGATLDYIGLPSHLTTPNFEFARTGEKSDWKGLNTQQQVMETFAALNSLKYIGLPHIICEIKSTDSHSFVKRGEPREWVDRLHPMYIPQLQVQMHVMEMEASIIIGQLGAGNMTAYFVPRDENFVEHLDRVNSIAEVALV